MALLGRRLNSLPFSLATLAPPPAPSPSSASFPRYSHATSASCCDIVRRQGFEGWAVLRLRAVPHQATAFA